MKPSSEQLDVGRYTLYGPIATGGMATVHFGRLKGPVGFARTVAIKRLHAHLARDPELVAMFIDEARLAARIRHPNVVGTLDVVAASREVLLVMDYVEGESLSKLVQGPPRQPVHPAIASAIFVNVLLGLHAAHEARSEHGEPLGIVHRDVSPQNILIGRDGIARVLDFGVAKASNRIAETADGNLKGKFSYMSPEQVLQRHVDRRTDIFAASSVLWETLTGRRLFTGDIPAAVVHEVVHAEVAAPSLFAPGISPALDALVLRGLAKDPRARWATAHEMAIALEQAGPVASSLRVADWVTSVAGATLVARAQCVAEIESESSTAPVPASELSGSALGGQATNAQATPPQGSGQTNVAMLTGVGAPGPRSARAMVGIALAAVAAGGLSTWLYLQLRSHDTAPGAAAGPSAAPPSRVPPSASSSAVMSVVETASVAAPSAVTATAAQGNTASAPATSSAPSAQPSNRRLVGGGRPQAPALPKPDCDNPFIVDANGRKRPKPGCF